jgi:tRNA (adenine57-N1/adenine58-N1)-methyltransferase
MVGDTGHVYSYDKESPLNLARKNIAKVGLETELTFKLKDIAAGIDETDLDSVFLDVPNPFDYLTQVRTALKSGGFFGCILPTINQVSKMMIALRQEKFSFIDICEILLRYYKNSALRLRPTDRMVAHTGYLVFARPIIDVLDEDSFTEEIGPEPDVL